MRRIGTDNAGDYNTSLLLQQGVWFDLGGRETLADFACTLLNIDLPAFRREVSTIMLNNGVVDEPEKTLLSPGDTLILSGAMPGLVGAMLRSDSPIKVMRDTISGTRRSTGDLAGEGRILVKFFNTVLRNHKQDLIRRGFYVDGDGQ